MGDFGVAAHHEIERGHIPGAVLILGEDGQIKYERSFGVRSAEPRREALTVDTIFDLASLTKVVATTTAVMQLVETGRLDLNRAAADYWPAFAQNGKAAITIRQLLTHTSGLPADLAPGAPWEGEAAGLAAVAAVTPIVAPGDRFLYSDINFIALGEIVRQISGEPLDSYATRHIFQPLEMKDTGFRPPRSKRARIAPTERENGQLRRGIVQDPTAYRMGGVAGHAGLFSTGHDLARFATMLLNGGRLNGARILNPETIRLMTSANSLSAGVRRGLGWDISSPYSAGMDVAFGPEAFGHTGYTGCLLWLDPVRRRFLILLTSRLYPDGRGDARPLRLEMARLIGSREQAPGPMRP